MLNRRNAEENGEKEGEKSHSGRPGAFKQPELAFKMAQEDLGCETDWQGQFFEFISNEKLHFYIT